MSEANEKIHLQVSSNLTSAKPKGDAMYIYQAITQDKRYIPPKETILEFPTEKEAIQYLEIHGGIYRNLLHKFEYAIYPTTRQAS